MAPADLRPTILTLLDHYLPGHKFGGPIRSVQHLAAQLGGEFRFRVVTRDRDRGDAGPFPGIEPGAWLPLGGAEVMYLRPAQVSARGLRAVLGTTPHDVLYLNSLFSPRMAGLPLLLRRAGRIPRRPMVLAPRGELHPGALATGTWGPLAGVAGRTATPREIKKHLYLAAARASGLLNGVLWQASTEHERADILRAVGPRARVAVAPALAAPAEVDEAPARDKVPGRLRAVFISRITRKKNLAGALDALRQARAQVELTVYGPVDDAAYWAECQARMAALPPNVRARYGGVLTHGQVAEAFRAHHLLLLPTLGENFGHVILESLAQGCPVLVSDQTPWRGLAERRAGWELPVHAIAEFARALDRCAAMGPAEFADWSAGAAALGREHRAREGPLEQNRELFRRALAGGGA